MMNLRHLKLWKRESKPDVVLRSPSSDSGYSDVPTFTSLFSRKKVFCGQASAARTMRIGKEMGGTGGPHEAGVGHHPMQPTVNTGCRQSEPVVAAVKPAMPIERFVEMIKTGDVKGMGVAVRENGFDVNVKDLQGRTVFQHALLTGITNNNLTICRLLIDFGCDVNAKDDSAERETALHISIRLGHLEAVKMLLESPGLDPVKCGSLQRHRMLQDRCLIEDVYGKAPSSLDDSDCTLIKRRSYGDQQAMFVRQCSMECVQDNFSSVGSETIRDLIIIQDDSVHHFDEVLHRIDSSTIRSLIVVDCRFNFDDTQLLGRNSFLRVLVLSQTRLRQIPSCVFQQLHLLEVLKVDRNNLEEIPDDIGLLCQLKTFTCDSQRPRLAVLPESISRLSQLEVLSCTDNKIENITWAATLPNLKIFRCGGNRITRLPTQMVNLVNLTWLDVSHNRIDRIPSSLLDMLKRLFRFDSFNLTIRPRGIIRSRTALFTNLELDNFLSRPTPGKNYVKDITITIFGETGSGKATLVEALKDDRGLCRLAEAKRSFPVGIVQFDMKVNSSMSECGAPQPPSTPCSDSARNSFAVGDVTRHVTVVSFSGDVLDEYTRDIQADVSLLLIDLTTLEHYNGSQHLFARHVGRLQMWLEALYEMAPDTPVMIVGTHAEVVKSVTFPDVCNLLDALLCRARQHHSRRYSESRSRNCLLCCQRSANERTALLAKSRSGHSTFVDVRPQQTYDAAVTTTMSNGFGSPTMDEKESHHRKSTGGKLRFPHVIGYYEIDSKKCFPKDSKKLNVGLEQLKAGIVRFVQAQTAGDGIPNEWLSFARHVIGVGEQSTKPSTLPYEDVVSMARSCDIPLSQVPLMLAYFHRRGKLIHFLDSELLARLVVINPAWLIQALERSIAVHEGSQTDAVLIQQSFAERDFDRQFQRVPGCSSNMTSLNGSQWLLSVVQRLEICSPLGLSGSGEKISFFPNRLESGAPSLDVWPDVPELDERQIAYDVGVRSLRSKMFLDFLLAINREGRQSLEIVFDPAPVFLANHVVFFSGIDVGGCEDCRWIRSQLRLRKSRCRSDDIYNARDDVLHKVCISIQPDMESVRIQVRGASPCCIMRSILAFLDRYLNDIPDECFVDGGCILPDQTSTVSCACLKGSDEQGHRRESFPWCNGHLSAQDQCCSEERWLSLLCPKCILLRDAKPERIFRQTMIPRNKAVCSKWHNLGSWTRAVTGDYRFTNVDRPFTLSPTTLPEYEHPHLVILLPPSTLVSRNEWYASSRMRFLEGFEIHFLCENPAFWHLTEDSGFRLPFQHRSLPSCRRDLVAKMSAILFGLAMPMIQLVQGVSDQSQTGRLLGSVVADLLRMYEYLRCVDSSSASGHYQHHHQQQQPHHHHQQQDAYAWLSKYKDRLVAMLTKVLANASASYNGDGSLQQTDLFVKAGASLSPEDVFQLPSRANRYEIGRFLRIETSSGRFGSLRPLYVGREVRWVCDAHYEELRTFPCVQFNS